MKKQDSPAALSTVNLTNNYHSKKESKLSQFIEWFRNFLDNAE